MAEAGALSHSSVQTYLECPLRWKFLYIDKLPEAPRGYFSFGRVVHSVLEELLLPYVLPSERRLESGERQRTLDRWGAQPGVPRLLTEEELLSTYAKLWVSDGYGSAEEETRYRELGADLLRRYRELLAKETPTPVAIEAHLETRWDGIPVHGYLDRIDRTPTGGLEIVDYKTSRDLSHEDALHSDQLTFYQVLVERNFTAPVEGLTLYHLRSLTPLRVPPRGKPTVERLHARVGQVSDGIRSQSFDPSPGRQCGRCEFKSLCPEFREVPAADRERLARLVDRFQELRGEERKVEEELRRTATELHREAERLGVHRLPGKSSTAVRRKEETWSFPPEQVRELLTAHGLEEKVDVADPEDVRRLLRDRRIDATLRREVERTGGRRVRWYWELRDDAG